MDSFRKNIRWYVLGFIFVLNFFIWYAVFTEGRGNILTVAVLDIGQGDAIFIEAPNGNQVMFDGGPPYAVLKALGKVMPFYDRSLDMLVVTNPDTDHMAGFIDILKSYSVGEVMEPGTKSDSATYATLEKTIQGKHVPTILARRGMKIVLDKENGVFIEILFPDRDVSGLKTNDGSIVARLVYGNTSMMLTGDSPSNVESYLVSTYGDKLKSDILKVGHHGSRTSTSEAFVEAISPTYALISDGRNNKYGHPHKETLDTLENFNVKTFRTDLEGTIIVYSDGESIKIK